MATKLTDKYLQGFIGEQEYQGVAEQVKAAHAALHYGTGLGNDFIGWLDLPTKYDKEEFARIKAAAEKIKKDTDVFIVIGIGGSYLGARAAIEFLTSQNYNLTCKDTPQIFFTGNSISSSALAELIELCEGKDVSVNMISKSGTTTEPAIAFRVFREMLENKYGKDGARERIYCTTDKARGTPTRRAARSRSWLTRRATRPLWCPMTSAVASRFLRLSVCCPSRFPALTLTRSCRVLRRRRRSLPMMI